MKLEFSFVNFKDPFSCLINFYLDNDRRLIISQDLIQNFKNTSQKFWAFKALVENLKHFNSAEKLTAVVVKIINVEVKLADQLLRNRLVPFVCKHNFVIMKHNHIGFLVFKDIACLFFLLLAVFFLKEKLNLLSVRVVKVKFCHKDGNYKIENYWRRCCLPT